MWTGSIRLLYATRTRNTVTGKSSEYKNKIEWDLTLESSTELMFNSKTVF